ncbi:MAG: phosphatidylserine synthase [Flavobacterium sp. BFFFF2]|nr:MAG: phosphatidylserine synthase [Flavobacterium sp. BFFFF2]
MKLARLVPNAFTMLNLGSGCVGLIALTEHRFGWALFWVALGIFFDFFDGFFARLLHVSSPLGIQLDSLADMVTSGVTPGMAVMITLLDRFPSHSIWPYLGFVITLGSCYRLAKFNLDTRQSDSFIGLPTPANALFFLSWMFLIQQTPNLWMPWMSSTSLIMVMVGLSAWVMNAEIPLFSLKVKAPYSWQKYQVQILFLLFSIGCMAFLQWAAIPIIILVYVLTSVVVKPKSH